MKATLRRIGNSIGIIIPKTILDAWNMREGNALHVSVEGIFPGNRMAAHELLDEQKRKLAAAVAAGFTPRQIRAHSLANLHRWRESRGWVSADDQWEKHLASAPDRTPLS